MPLKMALFFHLLAFLTLHLPRSVVLKIVRLFAWLRYLTTPGLRRRLRANLKVVLRATGRDFRLLEPLVRAGYYNFGVYLYEFCLVPRMETDFIRSRLIVTGEEHLKDALRRGKGVISFTAHLGNWELAGIVARLLGYPVTAVALPHQSGMSNRFFLRRRRMKGVGVVFLGKRTRDLFKALRRNELVAVLGDRVFGPPVVKVCFFGRETVLPAGPALLALRAGCPVVPGFLVREGTCFRFVFEPPIEPDRSLPEGEAVLKITRQAAAAVEKQVSRYPDQWLVFDYVWKR